MRSKLDTSNTHRPAVFWPFLERLIGDHQHVAGKAERIAARDAGRGRRELVDQYRIFGMRNIDDADAGFLPFMSQIEDAPAIGPLLDRESFAAVAIAVEIVVADQGHVAGFGDGLCECRRGEQRNGGEQGKWEQAIHLVSRAITSSRTASALASISAWV